jgi:SWI/SNF-related matrix-associated actin-dependent regulator 1 of chromatin subfamily A
MSILFLCLYRSDKKYTMADHQYASLRLALTAFQSLFEKQILNRKDIELSRDFLDSVVRKPTEQWSYNEAFRIHGIIKPFASKMKLIGFDFSAVPIVQYEVKKPDVSRNTKDRIIGYNGVLFIIRFPYLEDLVAAMKLIKGARWDPDKNWWTVPLSSSNELKQFAMGLNFDVGESAHKMLNSVHDNFEYSYSTEYIELNLPLKMQLYGYQTVGVEYLSKNMWAICGDQQRLGKTPQSIGAVLKTDTFPCIVVCSKSLRLQWQNEWQAWTSKNVIILDKKNVKNLPMYIESGLVDVVITNYDGVETFFIDEIKTINVTSGPNAGTSYEKVIANDLVDLFKSVILDEAHHCRNTKTRRYKTMKQLFDGKMAKYCLTGTPIVKGPQDFAALLELIGRIDDFGGRYNFLETYRDMDKKFLNVTDKDNAKENQQLKELNIKLRSLCFIRRERWQIPNATPEKYRSVIDVDIDNRVEYDLAADSLQNWLDKSGASDAQKASSMNAEMLVRFGILKQLSSKGKIEAVKEFVEDIMESGEKALIGVWFNDTVQQFKNALKKYNPVTISGFIDGRPMKDAEIEENKRRFQNDPNCQIIICTYGKGSEGHTLDAADHVLLPELGWTHKDQAQIEDRAVKVGKKKDVLVTYFLGHDTLDRSIYNVIESRRLVSKQSTGGSEDVNILSVLGKALKGSRSEAAK